MLELLHEACSDEWKCDESRPNCSQCLHRQDHCDFASQPSSEEFLGPISTDSKAALVSQISARKQIRLYLEKMGVPGHQPTYDPADTLELLDHFMEATTVWIGSPKVQKVMQEYGLQLSLTAPYLLHSIAAFSASHLSLSRPNQKKYSMAAILHYERSLTSYSIELRTHLDASNADSIIGCSHLQTMLAFGNVYQSLASFSGGGEFAWLRAMRGVTILWDTPNLRPHLENSIWYRVCIDTRASDSSVCNHTEPDETNLWASHTSTVLHQLCDRGPNPGIQENPYQVALSHLCPLMRGDIGQGTIGPFMFLIGSLPSSYIELLDRKDPRAMLILCYWSTFLSQIDQWWITRSAKIVCTRLCKYLDTIPDSRIHDLLRFPASKCGYSMQD
jgi:hypothetical protein